jgi:hypothetical protein
MTMVATFFRIILNGMALLGFCLATPSLGRVLVSPIEKQNPRPSEIETYDKEAWKSIIRSERIEHSKLRFIENTASGLAIFAVGTYGSRSSKGASFTTSVYSFLQTGGLILVSNGIHDYMTGSLVVDMNRFFIDKEELSRSQMRGLWVRQHRRDEYATVVSDLFLWSSLGLVYLDTALNDKSLTTTSRSIYLFLATNSIILGGVATYKYFNFSDKNDRFSLVPSSAGPALAWTRDL